MERPAQGPATRGTPGLTSSAERDRAKIRAAITLLADLAVEHRAAEDLDQLWFERWIGGNPAKISHITGFLVWGHRCGILPSIEFHHPRYSLPMPATTAGEQLRRLRNLLDPASDLPLEVRAAGALILLYGIPLTHIRQLTTADLDGETDAARLTIDKRSLLLPPSIADVLQRLAERPHRSGGHRFLFPSPRMVDAPLSTGTLTKKLNAHGIQIRAERNTTLAHLASEMPPAVLAEVLGLHINTAVRWSVVAAQDWSHYLRARRPLGPS